MLLAVPGLADSAERPARLDYSDILREVANLERLPYLEDDVLSRQFSSYHRGSRYDRESGSCVGMDINGDAGHTLTVHSGPEASAALQKLEIPPSTARFAFGDLQWVLDPLERNDVVFLPGPKVESPRAQPPKGMVAAIPGPGCIYRIWSANPMGTIRLYLDGSTQPLELDFKAIFLGGVTEPSDEALAKRAAWPFLRPFTYRRPGEQNELASDCYLPISFQKSCIVTLDQASFYHFGYKTFPAQTQVETFHLPLDPAEVEAFDEVSRKLLAAGADPKPRRPGTEETTGSSVLEPGQVRILADLKGPRVIQALHAKLAGNERYAHSKALLEAFFDDEPEACVWSPLVNFFGSGFEPRDYRSLPLGSIDGEGYSYFPMPFRKRARIRITNEGSKPVTLSYRIVHAPAPELPPNTMHFKCKYRREPVSTTFDYPLLECTGRGRFCGAALSIDDAWRSWWGEGDEKIWVDDDVFPSFFGTGSEDYFGDAWGIRTLHQPFFACSLYDVTADHSWTSCYRYQIPDDVPFREKIRVTIENYPETIWGTQAVSWDEDYVSTTYWYQLPGGSDFFSPVPVEQRRPWGKVPAPPFVDAEDVLAAELQRGARLVNDEDLDRELSRGFAIDLGARKTGDTLTFLGPELILEGPYTVLVHTPQGAKGLASFELFLGDQRIGQTPPNLGGPDAVLVGAAVFPIGRSELRARAKITSHSRISSSRHLRPPLPSRILDVALLRLRIRSVVATESGANLSANSANLFLHEPLRFASRPTDARSSTGSSSSPCARSPTLERPKARRSSASKAER